MEANFRRIKGWNAIRTLRGAAVIAAFLLFTGSSNARGRNLATVFTPLSSFGVRVELAWAKRAYGTLDKKKYIDETTQMIVAEAKKEGLTAIPIEKDTVPLPGSPILVVRSQVNLLGATTWDVEIRLDEDAKLARYPSETVRITSYMSKDYGTTADTDYSEIISSATKNLVGSFFYHAKDG